MTRPSSGGSRRAGRHSRLSLASATRLGDRGLLRNAALSLAAQAAAVPAALIAIPITLHGLGSERFGALSIAWVVLSYVSILDLGIGRATTRFAARAISAGDEPELGRLASRSLLAQAIIGVALGVGFALLRPIAARVLTASESTFVEVDASIDVIAAA